MPYEARRGGHAPGPLREAFTAWIDDEEAGGTVEIDGHERPLRWIVGQLWNCTDCLPGSSCDALGIPRGSSYAVAVRHLRAQKTA